MHPGDESGPPIEVRVTDRRRFTETGDAREGAEPEASAAAAPVSPMTSPLTDPTPLPVQALDPTPSPAQALDPTPSAREQAPGEVLDLGVEAVFFIFYQSALIALGAPEVTDATDLPRPPDLVEARQAIEFLRVLEGKTAGNLSPEEAATLRQLLDDAQTRFVHAARSMAGGRQ